MRAYDIIEAKRDGAVLSRAQIDFMVQGYVDGQIPDYQMAAFCMAVYFRGMTHLETAQLTDAMARSGDQVDLSALGDKTVDKHSTGGVGDKTTLIVAPIVACLGGLVAKMSGRGLGHTGGTVDKLEAIAGYRTELSGEAFLDQVRKIGIAVVGQSGNLAPADKKISALRDVTATVESAPLIASSIMSKKLAAGSRSIVLDVKVGSGAFMKTSAEARELAQRMIEIGRACGRRMSAVLSNMDIPLGQAIGNGLEVREAIRVLQGEACPDLREVSCVLAAEMLCLCQGLEYAQSREAVEQALRSGAALKKFRQWIEAQGADPAWIDRPERFAECSTIYPLYAPQSGYLAAMNAQAIGRVAVMLGAGRERKEDAIDPAAGIMLQKKPGNYVEQGDVLAFLHTNRPQMLPEAEELFFNALTWAKGKPQEQPLILDILRMEE